MSLAKRILLVVMALFYVGAGILHFTNTAFYRPMMPPYLPAHDFLIYLSGVAEVALGIAVLVPATRQIAGWGIIALLVAVLPANFHIALYDVPIGGAEQGLGTWNWVRIPFQAVFIAWAWWTTLPSPPPRAAARA